MDVSVALYIIVAIGMCLALVGLGGAAVSLTRSVAPQSVELTVSVPGRVAQVVVLDKRDSLLSELTAHFSDLDLTSLKKPRTYNRKIDQRSLGRLALLVSGVGVFSLASVASLEMAERISITVAGLVSTAAGEFFGAVAKNSKSGVPRNNIYSSAWNLLRQIVFPKNRDELADRIYEHD